MPLCAVIIPRNYPRLALHPLQQASGKVSVEVLMAFEDRTLECRGCGSEFVFSSGEQEFFQERGLVNDPVRCPSCRATRRRTRAGVGEYAQQMYAAVCAECGDNTELPFEPKPGVQVYCKDCFAVAQTK